MLSGGGDTHGMPTMFFMVYGMILIQFFLSVFGYMQAERFKKISLLYAFRQVQPISSILAISFFELLVKIFVVLTIVLICFVLKIDIYVHDAISVIMNFFKVWLLGVPAYGTVFGLAYCYIPELKKVQQLVNSPVILYLWYLF